MGRTWNNAAYSTRERGKKKKKKTDISIAKQMANTAHGNYSAARTLG
jgi:hypothetical protein